MIACTGTVSQCPGDAITVAIMFVVLFAGCAYLLWVLSKGEPK